jgi:hypothetical protein
MPEPALTAGMIENNTMIYTAKIKASYTWKDPNTLELVVRYIESPHTETFSCYFHDNKLSVQVTRSFDYGKNKILIESQTK